MHKKLINKILLTVFALALVGSVGSQRGPGRHHLRHERSTRRSAWHRCGLFAKDHRRPSLCQENRPGPEESPAPGHLQQDRKQDHR